MPHQLYFRSSYLGRVDDVIAHQGTFIGKFTLVTERVMERGMERIIAFIDFCHDWFEAQATESPPDATCFDQFAELIGPNQWSVLFESGLRHDISDAPMFNGGRSGEVSWVLSDVTQSHASG
jgi:hypothetical protein